jgi:hypothetical protein
MIPSPARLTAVAIVLFALSVTSSGAVSTATSVDYGAISHGAVIWVATFPINV